MTDEKVFLSLLRWPLPSFLEPVALVWQKEDFRFLCHLFFLMSFYIFPDLPYCQVISPTFIKHQPGTWFLSGYTHTHTRILPQYWLASRLQKHAFSQFKGELTGIIGKTHSFWHLGSWNLLLLDILCT